MCEVKSRKNDQEQKIKINKKYSGQQQKEIDCDEPHSAPNEKMQPIQWTERPTSALVAVNSLWPRKRTTKSRLQQFSFSSSFFFLILHVFLGPTCDPILFWEPPTSPFHLKTFKTRESFNSSEL
jgi:hypothetical protein